MLLSSLVWEQENKLVPSIYIQTNQRDIGILKKKKKVHAIALWTAIKERKEILERKPNKTLILCSFNTMLLQRFLIFLFIQN